MTTDAFVRHYTQVADRSPVPVLLYNVTMYTGVNLLPEAVGILSQHPNIVGIKETNSDMVQFGEYLARAEAWIHGARRIRRHLLLCALRSARMAPSSRWPASRRTCATFSTPSRRTHRRGAAMNRQLAPLSKLVGATYGVPGLKAALKLLGLDGGVPRPPLQPVGQPAVESSAEQLRGIGPAFDPV